MAGADELDPETGLPFVILADELASDWSTSQQMVYIFSEEWVAKLDDAAENVHGAVAAASDNEDAGASHDEDEHDSESTSAQQQAARVDSTEHNRSRQQTLHDAFSASTSQQGMSTEEKIERLNHIMPKLEAFRADWLQSHGEGEEISSQDWPLSLRRMLKESQQLVRELRVDGHLAPTS